MLRCPVSLFSLVDRDRQFFKSSTGLQGPLRDQRQTGLRHSFCQHVVTSGSPLVVDDARADERVCGNPSVADYGIIAYLGVPVQAADGSVLGSFCVIDHGPRHWSEEDVRALEDLRDALTAEVRLLQVGRSMLDLLRERDSQELERERLLKLLIHDLRSPIASVLSALELLEAMPGEVAQNHEMLSAVRQSADDVLQMLNEMLEIHRMEDGRLRPELAWVGVSRLLLGIFHQMLPLVEAASQTLRFEPGDVTLQIKADASLLKRIGVNLVTNAVKYAGSGAVIEMGAEALGEEVVLHVDDNGPGISEDQREKIFLAFERGLITASHATRSFGLGLSFCRLAAEAHGGRIWVEESRLGGSRFCVALPRNGPDREG